MNQVDATVFSAFPSTLKSVFTGAFLSTDTATGDEYPAFPVPDKSFPPTANQTEVLSFAVVNPDVFTEQLQS